jgi:hypothetical protein
MAAPSFSDICDRLEIPEALRKHVSAGAAVRGKLAVARGILPAPPRTLLSMQYVLLGDADEGVRAEAEKSIVEMPSARLTGLLDQRTHPKILEFIVYRRTADVGLMEKAVLLRQINDKTICYLAEHTTSDHVAEIIGQNHERLLITPQVLRFLKRNSRTPAALIDRCESFLRLYNIDLDAESKAEQQRSEAARRAVELAEIAAAEEAIAQEHTNKAPAPGSVDGDPSSSPSAGAPSVGEDGFVKGPLPADFVPGEVYVPAAPGTPYQPPPGLYNPLADLLTDWGVELRADFVAPPYPVVGGAMPMGTDVAGAPLMPSAKLLDGLAGVPDLSAATELGGSDAADSIDLTGLSSLGTSDFAYGFDEEQDSFEGFLTGDGKDDEAAELSIGNAIAAMTVGDKIKLAYKGNKTVRELLIRDTNKLVSCAVVKSGRITDNEVMSIATNRSIHEDVIREMARVKEYLRKYPVKVALAGNPKTPIPVTIRLLNSLHVKDLKKLASNRNVSSAVFNAAAKLFKVKQSQRGG